MDELGKKTDEKLSLFNCDLVSDIKKKNYE